MAFQRTTTVGYSDLNQEGVMTLFSVCNHFQDTSSAHGEAAGQGSLAMLERGRSWFLAYGETVIHRRPGIGEELLLETWPTKARGFFGERAYVMKTKAGEALATCYTVWVLMDMVQMHPTKITDADMFWEELGEPLPLLGQGRKVRIPEDCADWGMDRVNYLFLDSNRHMNNAYYVGLTEQFVKDDQVQHFRVEYKKAAVEGDRLCYRGYRDEHQVTVVMEEADGEVFAVVEYTLV